MIRHPGNGHGSSTDLTSAVLVAKSGHRSDVAALQDRLDAAELYTPLAKSIPGVEEGQHAELAEDMAIIPHMLIDDEGRTYCALFTRPEFIEPFAIQLGWDTEGGPLQYVAFPARTALDMALHAIDDVEIVGVVINAGDASELMLRRGEVDAMLGGRAVSLAACSGAHPEAPADSPPIAASETRPPPELVSAIDSAIATLPAVLGYELTESVDTDGDPEPHLTLRLAVTSGDVDRGEIVAAILDGIKDVLPPPGYVDIAFDDSISERDSRTV